MMPCRARDIFTDTPASSTRDSRVEAGAWIRICDAQRTTVVGVVLHRYAAAVHVVTGEERRRVEALVVDEWLTMPSAVTVLGGAKRAHRTDAVPTQTGSTEQHRVPLAVAAVDVVVFFLGAVAAARFGKQAGSTQDTRVAFGVASCGASCCCCCRRTLLGFITLVLRSPPDQKGREE